MLPVKFRFPLLLVHAALLGQSAAQLYKQINPSVVFIRTDQGGASGFCIGTNGLIATSLHAVDGAGSVSIAFRSGLTIDSVELLAADSSTDLAILRANNSRCSPASLGDSGTLQPGQRIYVIGNPLARNDLAGSISDGLVSGIRVLEGKRRVIQISAPLSPGNSGGPVVSGEGNVVGIVAFKLTAGELLNFAVPIEELKALSARTKMSVATHSWGPGQQSKYESDAFHLDENISAIFRKAQSAMGTCDLEDAAWEEFVTNNGRVFSQRRIERREFGSLRIWTRKMQNGQTEQVIQGKSPRGEWTKVNGQLTKRADLKEDDLISHLVNNWYCFCPGYISLWRDVQASKVEIDGVSAWKVRVKEPFWGASLTFFFEIASGYLIQSSYPMKGSGIPVIVTDTFSEFRRVTGTAFVIPFTTMKAQSDGAKSMIEMITLSANNGYPDYFFDH
jgi:hypothetical protein